MWADGITKGLMDRLIHRPRDGQMGQLTDRAMDGQRNVWTEGQTDGPMDSKLPYRPIDRPTDADRQINNLKDGHTD